jgi:hypothetical protein
MTLSTGDGAERTSQLETSCARYPPITRSGLALGVYASRALEFLCDEPREANSEGGVFRPSSAPCS